MTMGSARAFELFIEALCQLEREHMRRLDAVPSLVDITVSLALMDGGEAAAEEILERVRQRIDDWRGGSCMPPVAQPNPGGGGAPAMALLPS
jgi:hypothetical protein